MKRTILAVVVAAAAGAITVAVTTNAAAPTSGIHFPAGFTTPIYVGETQIWPTTPPTTISSAPTTSTTTATTTSPPSSTTTSSPRATSTTMSPAMAMGNMPMVDPAKVPGPTSRNWTQPFLVNQQYPYQPSDGTGAFRVTTRYTNFGYADPIVYPGGASPHLHVFFGNTCITATTTDPTTCGSTTSDGGTLNKTGYWVPAIIDSSGAAQRPTDMQVYYKTGYKGVRPQDVKAFPNGLKIVAGDAKRTSVDPGAHDYDRIVNYECNNGSGAVFDHIPTHAEAQAGGCAPGTWLVMAVTFPQCWDGVNLDSPDHKSHMAYPNGSCPASHPVALPEISERALYTVPAGGIPDGWRLSSDNYPYNGSNAGYSGHADWMNGWDTATLNSFIAGCENVPRDCSMDLLGNGKQLGFGPN